jgi:hypothetical protein
MESIIPYPLRDVGVDRMLDHAIVAPLPRTIGCNPLKTKFPPLEVIVVPPGRVRVLLTVAVVKVPCPKAGMARAKKASSLDMIFMEVLPRIRCGSCLPSVPTG